MDYYKYLNVYFSFIQQQKQLQHVQIHHPQKCVHTLRAIRGFCPHCTAVTYVLFQENPQSK